MRRVGSETVSPRFPGDGPTLVTRTASSAISVTRYAPSDVGDGLDIRMPAEDAFVVVFQLREHPAHDFWMHGRFAPADAAPRATLNIVDLAADPRAQSTAPIDKLMFHLPRPVLDEVAETVRAPRVESLTAPLGWRTPDPVIEQMEGLILGALEGRYRNRLFVDHLLLGLTVHFAVTYGGLRTTEMPASGGLAPWQERRAKDLLASNLARDISLGEVAAECGLSISHFSRAFKASTGMPPHAWLQAQRVERAKQMLRRSSSSLAGIALECGFADQSHFTHIFGRKVGMSPGKWRRMGS
ncbi:AraC family transcriptional regulator [Enterovirga aerilata]|uniref:Helix-turn-helix transcriptional regulator n=1 Tax=Enterovirga aerilata TaxID=2730920 RepID=A0A849I696_9HYPH|nr:AraC family transcriptional regulator [Enterovirga sp. DB1703]NNM71620.1 helix-turn-helix transcriptional regulator [Enterovirga sp. DB1703]